MFTHFSKLVPKAIAKYGISREARAAHICARFRKIAPDIFPQDMLLHIWPKYVKFKTLILGVSHPIYAEEVAHQKHKILEKLAASLGKQMIASLKTVVDEARPPFAAYRADKQA